MPTAISQHTADFVVVGAGIAGASAAWALAERGRVVLLEREEHPGYHSTGRSAAIFHETYGRPLMRRFAIASRALLAQPPPGFAEYPLLTLRGLLFVAREDQRESLEAAISLAAEAGIECVDGPRAEALAPALRPGYALGALHEPDAYDIDVNALHQGFLRGLKQRGGMTLTNAELVSARHEAGTWRVATSDGTIEAPIVINAAGAWADEVAARCRVPTVGLQPLRRTALIVDAPAGVDVAGWPMVIDIDEEFYFKPDAGRILISPADETPRPPSDARPDEYDVAVAIDRFERATTVKVERVIRRWAGLRNFVADRLPVAGFDPDAEGFFWLAGQGGTGIMTSPAMARFTAALAAGDDLPADLLALGVDPGSLSPARLSRTP